MALAVAVLCGPVVVVWAYVAVTISPWALLALAVAAVVVLLLASSSRRRSHAHCPGVWHR